jgi:predicted transcriptional regulator
MVPVESDTAVLRSYNPDRRVLRLAQLLPPRSLHFQLAVQIGLLTYDEEIQRIVGEASFSSPAALTLARLAMANYFAGAVLMPYEPFVKAARAQRYDVELLGHRFRTSYEQVCHRLTTLRRPGREGVPFHMVRVDMAGNISKRFSGSGIRFARYGGACPKWNVHAAFLTPGVIRTQVSQMPDGRLYFCFARSIQQDIGGYSQAKHVHAVGLGCKVEHGRDIVYADGIDLEGSRAVIEVGVTCRLCDRVDCRQRAFPTLQHRLEIDENKRGINFYSPVDD